MNRRSARFFAGHDEGGLESALLRQPHRQTCKMKLRGALRLPGRSFHPPRPTDISKRTSTPRCHGHTPSPRTVDNGQRSIRGIPEGARFAALATPKPPAVRHVKPAPQPQSRSGACRTAVRPKRAPAVLPKTGCRIAQLEVSKWLLRERSSEEASRFSVFTTTLRVIALDTRIAVASAEICVEHKLATADAIIFATAQVHDATLLTCDSHFAGLPNTIVRAEQAVSARSLSTFQLKRL